MSGTASGFGARALVWLSLLLAVLVLAAVAAVPVVYDTLHVRDTTFLAMVSRWVQEGAVPGRDFVHFYGGLQEWFVARAFDLAGHRIKALDYALVLQSLAVGAMLLGVAWRRVPAAATALLFLLCVVLICARIPLEEYPQITRLDAAHSFAYNRLGTALAILSLIVVMVPVQDRVRDGRAELLGAGLAGLCITGAVLSKSTFFPLILAAPVALALQGRWRAALVLPVVAVAGGLLADPAGDRTLGTLFYAMDSADRGGGFGWLFRKAFALFGTQQVAVLAALAALAAVSVAGDARLRRTALSGVLMVGAFWASSVTMGPAGLAGHQAAPVLAAAALALWVVASGTARAQAAVLAGVLVAAFVIPHGLVIAGTTAQAFLRADEVALREGPMAGYLARSRPLQGPDGRPIRILRDPEAAAEAAARAMTEYGSGGDATTDYVALADALALLEGIPREGTGLVSDTRLGLGFAAGTRRVEGFPPWLRRGAPELEPGYDLLADVDMVLLTRPIDTPYTPAIRREMKEDFRLCRQSVLWDLYVRRTTDALCPEG